MRFKSYLVVFLSFIFLLSSAAVNPAESAKNQQRNFKVSWKLFKLSPDERQQAGINSQIMVGMFIKPDDGWYTYSHNPGKLGQPTKVQASFTPGKITLVPVYLPGKEKDDPFNPGKKVRVYEKSTPVLLPLPKPEKTFTVNVKLELLMCSKSACLPVKTELSFLGMGVDVDSLPSAGEQSWWAELVASRGERKIPAPEKGVTASGEARQEVKKQPLETVPQDAEDTDSVIAEGKGEVDFDPGRFEPRFFSPGLEVDDLGMAILFGLLAGFLLNFMPCVLPVISLKLSVLLSGTSGESDHDQKRTFREHNLFFSAGILIYFGLLSLLLGFTGLAWGQIFQKPAVVVVLTGVVFALSLSLFGLYNLPVVDLKFGSKATGAKRQAFFTGFLATLLATPCSGPFLGGVLGWAMIQPPFVIGSVFFSVGLGMALPYIMMSIFPGLVKKFPRPGAWTGWVEKAAGFFLAGTCIYLISILPESMTVSCLIFLWFAAVAAWIWGMSDGSSGTPGRFVLRSVALAIFVSGAVWAATPAATPAQWISFEEQDFSERLGNENMLVEFTADWCPSCKVLEKTVLTPSNLAKWKKKYDLTFIKVDLTSPDKEADDFLRALGSRSIPLAAVFSRGGKSLSPLVLRDLYTTGQLEEALEDLNQ